mmetsp:Transcript_118044/g.338618  ORF Transcript_118044/g.338618 Transcript_118044/m.338618 type:complete len:121 (-) Transcript_118044:21-383(-)
MLDAAPAAPDGRGRSWPLAAAERGHLASLKRLLAAWASPSGGPALGTAMAPPCLLKTAAGGAGFAVQGPAMGTATAPPCVPKAAAGGSGFAVQEPGVGHGHGVVAAGGHEDCLRCLRRLP